MLQGSPVALSIQYNANTSGVPLYFFFFFLPRFIDDCRKIKSFDYTNFHQGKTMMCGDAITTAAPYRDINEELNETSGLE